MGNPAETESASERDDLRSRYDILRTRCPVAHEDGHWVVLRHAEVVTAAQDPLTFSSKITPRRAIPNSLDGAEHAAYRAIVDRYLTPERVAREEDQCRTHAAGIIDALPRDTTVKTIASIGTPYAVRAQSTRLGWPQTLEDELVRWIADNHAATRSGDRTRTREVAERFDHMIGTLLEARRDTPTDDVTSELMADTVEGRPLTDDEIVSILRNWTAGDLGSLATSVGVVVHFIAAHPAIQRELRAIATTNDQQALSAAIAEILRIDDPFVSNRRVTTRAVTLGGQDIAEGQQILLNWTAANRDPLVFDDPDQYNPTGNAEANLVFGTGPHECPGKELTLMELGILLEELLARTTWIDPAPDRPAVREDPPIGGWARVPVVLRGHRPTAPS
jgi:cytochrome P450